MPTLNQARFIDEAAASVLDQRVPGLELLVVDGGSVDGTLDRLAALAQANPGRIRWRSAPDRGPAAAVNAGVALARAPIVGWLNSDDLYAPGAIARALACFAAQPKLALVYGEGEHVDERGASPIRYPTAEPAAALTSWADGCHLCQPTAFFRREAFDAVGGLDESLHAAFDFDLWLRMLAKYRGRIGFVPQVQARTRLHPGAITMRLRERVALEGIQVVHRHIGPAPIHWLLTHFDELQALHPFGPGQAEPLLPRLERLVREAVPWLAADGPAQLTAHIQSHAALRLSSANVFVPLHADGWTAAALPVRVRQPATPWASLRLHARHASPLREPVVVEVATPDGGRFTVKAEPDSACAIDLPLADRRSDARMVFTLRCQPSFRPCDVEPGSTDERTLGIRIERLEPRPA